jgi:Flp pilus assembly pilin Flp
LPHRKSRNITAASLRPRGIGSGGVIRLQNQRIPGPRLHPDKTEFMFSQPESALMKRLIINFLRNEQGQDLVEYALLVAAVGLALIATVGQLGAAISSVYQSIIGGLSTIAGQP